MTEFKNGEQVLLSIREHLARHDNDIIRLHELQREREGLASKCRENIAERLYKMETETKDALHSLEKQISKVSWTVTAAVAIVVTIAQFVLPLILRAT